MNNLRIVSIEKSENAQEEIKLKEIIEEEEKYIPKYVFDYSIIAHLMKLKIKPQENKKIVITIFNQNRGDFTQLLKTNLEEQVKNSKIQNSLEFLKKIGFIPTNEMGDYKVEYKLYDLCEQNLIYHLFLTKQQKLPINKTILLLKFDKLVLNYAIYDEGKINDSLKEEIDNKDCKNTEDFIFNLIKKANNLYGGINLILSHIDYKEEEKKTKLNELFENIKKYCSEQLDPKVEIVIYKENEIDMNMFKYMNLFYEN